MVNPFLRQVEASLLREREERLLKSRGHELGAQPEVDDGRRKGLTEAMVRRSDRLRARREAVAALVAKGLGVREIARKLSVCRRTVISAKSAFAVTT